MARGKTHAFRDPRLDHRRSGRRRLTLLPLLALGLAWASSASVPTLPTLASPPNFRPATREVDIWRREAVFALDLAPESALSLLSGDDLRGVTRCVKLNNYWCIKRAGWSGEIAADGEGHVAFASAREGAAVAALLLRRYYVDFGLKTARAIVSRWAPIQCGAPALARSNAPRLASVTLGGGLATRGLGNTMRARWLATHTIGGFSRGNAARAAPRPPAAIIPAPKQSTARAAVLTRRSVVRDVTVPLLATPSIMAGFGAPAISVKPGARLAMLPYAGIPMGPAPAGTSGGAGALPSLPPLTSCASDGVRIANYAAKTADGVVSGPDIDLALFDGDGRPSTGLARVLANMAAVEIGPLRVSDALVQAGIAVVAARVAATGKP